LITKKAYLKITIIINKRNTYMQFDLFMDYDDNASSIYRPK